MAPQQRLSVSHNQDTFLLQLKSTYKKISCFSHLDYTTKDWTTLISITTRCVYFFFKKERVIAARLKCKLSSIKKVDPAKLNKTLIQLIFTRKVFTSYKFREIITLIEHGKHANVDGASKWSMYTYYVIKC